MECIINSAVDQLIDLALQEDIGTGDLTGIALIPEDTVVTARFLAKQDLVVCGLDIAKLVFKKINDSLDFEIIFPDKTQIHPGEVFAEVRGRCRDILAGERVSLNFLQRLSGIATQASNLVNIARSHRISLLDTRKTTPGWRTLEKYAVHIGGGINHRMGLYDQILIKNNHLDVLHCNIETAMERARRFVRTHNTEIKIQIEVRSESELRAALKSGAEVILLDNMSPNQIVEMVRITREELKKQHVFLEVSGGINETILSSYLIEGINAISLGMLTHSVRAADISLRLSA